MQVTFLPWLRIKDEIKIGKFTISPFPQPGRQLAILSDQFSNILKNYVTQHGDPINDCAVIFCDDCNPTWDVTNLSELKQLSLFLFMAGVSCNEYYFSGSYCNSEFFKPITQRFVPGESGFSLVIPRRDGSITVAGGNIDAVKFHGPAHYKNDECIEIDLNFLNGLGKLWSSKSEDSKRILSGISFFALSFTDTNLLTTSAEIVLLVSAYENILGVDGNAREVARAVGELFLPFGSIPVASVTSKRPDIKLNAKYLNDQMQWFIHKKWSEELYEFRNNVIHNGKREDWGWSELEHVVMGSFALPIILKLILEKMGFYKFTDEDSDKAHCLDLLLSETDWGATKDYWTFKWRRILSEEMRSRDFARALKKAFKDGEG